MCKFFQTWIVLCETVNIRIINFIALLCSILSLLLKCEIDKVEFLKPNFMSRLIQANISCVHFRNKNKFLSLICWKSSKNMQGPAIFIDLTLEDQVKSVEVMKIRVLRP